MHLVLGKMAIRLAEFLHKLMQWKEISNIYIYICLRGIISPERKHFLMRLLLKNFVFSSNIE